jgi:ectoine hydroxylase-related dioxygenase (phytanoyl-CoA dioxygenase family)
MVEKYGVLKQNICANDFDLAAELLRIQGYATIQSDLNQKDLDYLKTLIETLEAKNQKLDSSIRAPFFADDFFTKIALDNNVLQVLSRLIVGRVMLLQQNVVINNPLHVEKYSQARFHRDLPYQHAIFSRPLAINALLCVDDFTVENGATLVLPGTHKIEEFPSEQALSEIKIQVQAKSGTFILLDGMTFHAGASNRTDKKRIGVNHVYGSPILRPQIDYVDHFDPERIKNLLKYGIKSEQIEYLGLEFSVPRSVSEFAKTIK